MVAATLDETPKTDIQPHWTLRELAERARISERTLFRYLSLGKIASVTIATRRLIPHAEAMRIMREGLSSLRGPNPGATASGSAAANGQLARK